jgi:hypothetical protein
VVSSSSTFEIAARIDHLSDGVGCFDPIQVMCRMRGTFPELIEEGRDYLSEAYERLRQIACDGSEGAEGALRVAVRDMQERGPKILFRIPLPDGRSIRGTAERYCVFVASSEDFPEDFRRRFTHFLHGLHLQPIQVAS